MVRRAGPAGLPQDLLVRLKAAVARASEGADARDALLKQGLEPFATTHQQFAAFVHGELALNAAIVKEAGIKAE